MRLKVFGRKVREKCVYVRPVQYWDSLPVVMVP